MLMVTVVFVVLVITDDVWVGSVWSSVQWCVVER